MQPPKRPSPQRPPSPPAPPAPAASPSSRVAIGDIAPVRRGQRIVIYGTGGIGKTTLACQLEGVNAFIDADESLGVLRGQLESIGVPLPKVVPVGSWVEMMTALRSPGWEKVNNIIIDTATKLEEWAVARTLQTVKKDSGSLATSIEDYGFGKGFQFVFDTFLPLLAELDRHVRDGRNVVLIAHDCTANVPNPSGENYIRYEPRLQNPASGKASIRLRVKEWADHVLFVGYDLNVEKGKAKGSGTRTLYTSEQPFCMAKSRTTGDYVDIVHGESPWAQIIK